MSAQNPPTREFPHVLTLLLGMMVLFTALTWLLPAGEFERQEVGGREVVKPGTYQRVDQQGQKFLDFLRAPIKGFRAAADIIGFVFLVGGAFAVVNRTGAIEAALKAVIRWCAAKPTLKLAVIPILMVLFSLGGSTFGMAEEVLVFILITVPLARSLGYDEVVGVAIPFVGAGVGFAGAFVNPFTLGIAQGIAELPPGSGFRYRLFCWFVMTLAGVAFVAYYASRLDQSSSEVASQSGTGDFNSRHLVVLSLLASSIGLLVYGVNTWGWYIEEIAALFFGLGLLSAAAYGLAANEAVEAFVEGTQEVVVAALIIGFSRGLLVLAEQGKIIDTLLNLIVSLAEGFPAAVSVVVMFFFQSFLNFFVPSGSGQAALTMPIMAPLSDLLGISRQVAVLCYQFGDGISNLIIPTSGITMGVLQLGEVEYDRWFRFALPLVLLLSGLAIALLLPPVVLFAWQ